MKSRSESLTRLSIGNMNEIIRWKPFLAISESYCGKKTVVHTFRCPHCGGKNCDRKLPGHRKDDRHFYQGNFRCSDCGARCDKNGDAFNYYSDCFIRTEERKVIQQSLFE